MEPTILRPLGRTAPRVTPFGFGAAPIGGFRFTMPEREAIGIVERT